MAKSSSQVVRIGAKATEKLLSKAQKEFNRLTQKAEKLEKDTAEYQQAVERIRQQVMGDYVPLNQTYQKHRADWVRLLDRAHSSGFFKKTEQKKLVDLIINISFELIDKHGFEELKPVYNKYDPEGFDTTSAETDQATAEMLKNVMEMFGIQMDDDIDISSPDKFQEHLQQKLKEQQATAEEQQRQADERRAKRPKSPKQLERETKKQQEERNITKAVRTIYMDLVKAFHPDREPDEAEKQRKTDIMHRVTEAYEKSDLLALLRLQLEFDRIDQDHLETLAEDQLKYYNKILKQQVQELEESLFDMQQQMSAMSGQPLYMVASPTSLEFALKNDLRQLKANIKAIQKELKLFTDNTILKQWLKTYRIQKAEDDFPF